MRPVHLRILAAVAALAGLLILLYSPTLGVSDAKTWLIGNGSADTNQFLAIQSGAMAAYRIMGGVLLGVGLFRALQPTEKGDR
jgi:hypothetical protein